MRLQRILACVDGSEPSRLALEWAAGVAESCGAEVVAVHAVGLLAYLAPDRVVPADAHRDELRQVFEEKWCEPLTASDVAHRKLLVDGAPAVALLETADSEDVDLLVMGRRGIGGAPSQMLGSTSQRIVQLCDRPVLVVPTRAEAGADG